MRDKRASDSSGDMSASPPYVMPYRRRGQPNPDFDGLRSLQSKQTPPRGVFSAGNDTISEIKTIVSAYEEAVDRDDGAKVIPQRTFEVGPRDDILPNRKNGFLTTGVVGGDNIKVAYKPKDEASSHLMKPGVGSALRREDTRYGQNLASALASRGLITNKRVLVLGSGCARSMASFFSRSPSSVLCVDNDGIKVSVLRRLVMDMDMDGVVTVVKGDACDAGSFTTPGESFDLILVTKSFGSILSGSKLSAENLVSRWMPLLANDGVMAVDTQTYGHTYSPNGKVSGCFPGEDSNVASIWGRYDDDFYDLEDLATTTGVTIRERLNLSVRGNCGKQGEAILDSMAQMWVMYLISHTSHVLNPVVPTLPDRKTMPVTVSGNGVVMAGGCDLLPPYINGSKIVPWRGIGDVVTREHVYPKFDGVPGLMYYADGQITFVGKTVTLCKSAEFYHDDYCFLAEACEAKLSSGGRTILLVVLGVVSINGVSYDPNDLETLNNERKLFENKLLPYGAIVTSPNLLLSLRDDVVRVVCKYRGLDDFLDVPVDGLNVSVGGAYGNFLKPQPMCTLDLCREQDKDFNEALSMAMLDDWECSVEWTEEPGVWEYSLKGDVFRPIRRREDKVKGASVVRLSQDLAACMATSTVFSRADTVWQLYNTLVSRMSTYRGSRAERSQFFIPLR